MKINKDYILLKDIEEKQGGFITNSKKYQVVQVGDNVDCCSIDESVILNEAPQAVVIGGEQFYFIHQYNVIISLN